MPEQGTLTIIRGAAHMSTVFGFWGSVERRCRARDGGDKVCRDERQWTGSFLNVECRPPASGEDPVSRRAARRSRGPSQAARGVHEIARTFSSCALAERAEGPRVAARGVCLGERRRSHRGTSACRSVRIWGIKKKRGNHLPLCNWKPACQPLYESEPETSQGRGASYQLHGQLHGHNKSCRTEFGSGLRRT